MSYNGQMVSAGLIPLYRVMGLWEFLNRKDPPYTMTFTFMKVRHNMAI